MRAILLLILSVFLITSCNKNAKTNEKTDNKKEQVLKKKVKQYEIDNKSILLSLPKNTEAIINVKSIESVFSNFLITENSIFGIPFKERDLRDFNEVKEFFSFNPLNLKDLENLGIDTKKEFGIAFSDIIWGKRDDLSSINIVGYIPLKDSKKTLAFIENKFKNGKFKSEKKMELNLKKENGYLKIFGNRVDEVLYIFVKNNYLFITINPLNPQNSLNLTTSMLKKGDSLKDSKLFQKSSKLTKTNNGIYLYGNLENLIDSNKVRIEKEFSREVKNTELLINMLKSYRSLSMSLAFDTKELLLDFSAVLNKDSKALSILKGIKQNNSTILGLDKPALYLISFGINIPEYLKLVKSFIEGDYSAKLDEQIDKTSKEFGIDIKKDVINNFDGNFSFATYDGMSVSTTNYNSILSIGFKDVKAIQSIFNKLLENPKLKDMAKYVNKAKEDNKDIFIINAMITQIYVGFKKNELIIASNKDMYKSALSSNAKNGFYKSSQKDNHLKASVNAQMMFYISFLEVIKALNNFKAMLPPEPTKIAIDSLELLDYFLATTNINETSATGGYVLKTHSNKMFFPAVADIVKKYK